MGLSYQEVLVDVVRYKYLLDEGFISTPVDRPGSRFLADGFFRHLVRCITEDTGMSCETVERGLIHAAIQHGRLDSGFFEDVVTRLYA